MPTVTMQPGNEYIVTAAETASGSKTLKISGVQIPYTLTISGSNPTNHTTPLGNYNFHTVNKDASAKIENNAATNNPLGNLIVSY